MLRIALKYLKVLYPVILRIPVLVVNNLSRQQVPSKVLLHYQAML
jgi:hypothetical protein